MRFSVDAGSCILAPFGLFIFVFYKYAQEERNKMKNKLFDLIYIADGTSIGICEMRDKAYKCF